MDRKNVAYTQTRFRTQTRVYSGLHLEVYNSIRIYKGNGVTKTTVCNLPKISFGSNSKIKDQNSEKEIFVIFIPKYF